MALINLESLTNGFKDRMRRLALMAPLEELSAKRTVDQKGQKIDMQGLGMLTLLFFFERRLSRAYKTSRKDVTEFLSRVIGDTYAIPLQEMEKITDMIIEVFRPQDGKKRHYSFFNWETKTEEEISYSILKAHDFDPTTETQYYTLDDDGLELLFSTKEFYSEYQISINQLLLKQQINKGQFHEALRQVREMEVSVSSLIERFQKMRNEIVRSIISDQTFERYKQLIEEAHERFAHEDEEFVLLKQFVKETRDTMYRDNLKQIEPESYETVHKIANELDEVHYEHTRLIELTAQLRNTAIATAQESLYYTGVQSFNFEKDIVATILAKPLSPDVMKGVLHPFLKIEQHSTWSLLTVLEEQNIMEARQETESYHFPEVAENQREKEYREWISEKYAMIMEKFIQDYQAGSIQQLRHWMDQLKITNPDLLQQRYFYSFWMFMHQVSPLQRDNIAGHEQETVLQHILKPLKNDQLTVIELPDIIHYDEKYSVQNMHITLEKID